MSSIEVYPIPRTSIFGIRSNPFLLSGSLFWPMFRYLTVFNHSFIFSTFVSCVGKSVSADACWISWIISSSNPNFFSVSAPELLCGSAKGFDVSISLINIVWLWSPCGYTTALPSAVSINFIELLSIFNCLAI